MTGTVRWILVAVVVALLVLLIAYARGTAHHRGNEVGALAPVSATPARV